MIKVIQTKLHKPPEIKGNCFAAVIASFLECSITEILPFENFMDYDNSGKTEWVTMAAQFLASKGWDWGSLDGHTKGYYLVIGNTHRSPEALHVCIYRHGKLWHDPHPDQQGLTTEKHFEYLLKL